jgi:Domain of unknown function (DUF4476)
MRKITFLLLAYLPLILFAQTQKTGNLTIFSEDGDKFFIVLNGEKQNNVAQANLRVEELTLPQYHAKIIFEDSSIASLTKNNLSITGLDDELMDVTYKLKKDKTGKAKLNYFTAIPVQQNFIPASGTYVFHYGKPTIMGVSTGASITTTSVTTSTATEVMSTNLNIPGISMNVSISDPFLNQSHVTTTSTTVTTNSNSNQNTNSKVKCKKGAMNQTDFTAAIKVIKNSSFDDTKLSTAKSVCSANCVSSEQVVEICRLFSFEESKLTFAKYAFQYCTNPEKYFKVNDVFSFSSSKEQLNEFVSN